MHQNQNSPTFCFIGQFLRPHKFPSLNMLAVVFIEKSAMANFFLIFGEYFYGAFNRKITVNLYKSEGYIL
jgi:hypothetical protein